MDFTVKGTYDRTRPGVALVPPSWWSDQERGNARYVRLSAGSTSESLEVAKRSHAGGTEIWVTPGTLGLSEGTTRPVVVREISPVQFRNDRLLRTTDGRLALAGLLTTVVGLGIPISFSFGETFFAVFLVSPTVKSIFIWLSPLLGLAGVLLVFVRGVWLRGA